MAGGGLGSWRPEREGRGGVEGVGMERQATARFFGVKGWAGTGRPHAFATLDLKCLEKAIFERLLPFWLRAGF